VQHTVTGDQERWLGVETFREVQRASLPMVVASTL
jgi:hypothetical protein